MASVPRGADGSFRVESVLQRRDAPEIGWHDLGVFCLTPALLSRVAAHAFQHLEESGSPRSIFPRRRLYHPHAWPGKKAQRSASTRRRSLRPCSPVRPPLSNGHSEICRREKPATAAAARRFGGSTPLLTDQETFCAVLCRVAKIASNAATFCLPATSLLERLGPRAARTVLAQLRPRRSRRRHRSASKPDLRVPRSGLRRLSRSPDPRSRSSCKA